LSAVAIADLLDREELADGWRDLRRGNEPA